MREHVSQSKKATTASFSIPSLKHRIPGFGLESSQASPQAVPLVQPLHKPLTHDISRIPLRNPQAKLSISQPGDKYEQEADSVAQQVMQRIAQPVNRQSIQPEALPEESELQMKPMANSITPLVQRQEMPESESELQMKSLDNSTLQREALPEDEEELQMKPMVQRRAEAFMADAPDLEASINQARGGGQAMAENIRHPMEVAFGTDFSKVKVHTDGQSDQLNRSIQARAFTTGHDVFFRQGEYNPGSRGGQELLAHELTHVVQQNKGAVQRSPLSPEVQREAMPEEEDIQAKSTLQRRGAIAGGEASTDIEFAINRARGNGQSLDAGLQESMGQAMGADFSRVKVHTDAQSDQLNQSIQAKAFTTGQDVFFRQGAYQPGSRGGQELIAHELTHVVQQNGGDVRRSPLSYKATDSKTVEHVIQRYDMTYGALNNDCGTDMHVLIEGNNDPDLLTKGSKPSVLPSWWPGTGTPERNYFQQYVVQGHLLNQNLGGPGNTMENLTPITKSTNTTHFKHIEDEVKKEVNKGNWVEYRVQADYKTHPLMSDLGVGVPAGVAPYLAYFAGEIGADYTVYHPQTGIVTGGLPGVKLIKNEGKHLKGTF